ncbi:MAG: hypothetical protein V4787_21270 [Pseudomonadota bacterium]
MSLFDSPRFLRYVLVADALSCVATGLAQLLFASMLAQWLALPGNLLVGTGWFLLAYAAVVGFIATRDPIPSGFVWLFVAGNVAWAILCVVVLASGSIAPTTLGVAWILGQAAVVVVLAELQWTGLRRQAVASWA